MQINAQPRRCGHKIGVCAYRPIENLFRLACLPAVIRTGLIGSSLTIILTSSERED
jgi:hypothetical protein